MSLRAEDARWDCQYRLTVRWLRDLRGKDWLPALLLGAAGIGEVLVADAPPAPGLQILYVIAAAWAILTRRTSPMLSAGVFLAATIVVSVGAVPIQMLTIGLAFETTSFFQDFAYNTPGGVDRLTFNQPCVLTGGVAVRPLDMLLVAADVEWINWPATNGANKPAFSQNASGAMPWNMNWSSQVVFKLGVQVTPLDWLSIRAGYNYGKMPLNPDRAFENIAFPAVAENHVTLGAGFNLGKHVAVNLGGMWAPSTSITGSNPNPPMGTPGYPGPYGQGIQTYTTSMTQVGLDAGIAYKF